MRKEYDNSSGSWLVYGDCEDNSDDPCEYLAGSFRDEDDADVWCSVPGIEQANEQLRSELMFEIAKSETSKVQSIALTAMIVRFITAIDSRQGDALQNETVIECLNDFREIKRRTYL